VGHGWKIRVQDAMQGERKGREETCEFDHVVVATGFFGAPRIPSSLLNHAPSNSVPVFHSSRFRDVRDLFTHRGQFKPRGKRVVVIGGQMSGVEAAANVALQLSSAVNSPSPKTDGDLDLEGDYEVVHVVQKPVWVMPLFLPNNPQRVGGGGGEEKVCENFYAGFLPFVSQNGVFKCRNMLMGSR
jgi:hypothetical protein